jgi:hypothetical protein
MYVCTYVYYLHMSTTYICTYVYYLHMYICLLPTYVHMSTTYICTYVCVCTYVYYICTYVYLCRYSLACVPAQLTCGISAKFPAQQFVVFCKYNYGVKAHVCLVTKSTAMLVFITSSEWFLLIFEEN